MKCVVYSTGVEATSEEQCLGKRPLSEDRCNITPCDFCGGGNPCLGRGVCDGGKCTCKTDYTGSYCETPVACTGGVVDALLACCDSGLVNVRGECCSMGGTVLDGDGECCSESLDACGVCGGLGQFLDMEGSCCAVADANGVCCPSGLVDECGVCNGVGNSCAIELATEVQVPSSLIQGGAVLDDPLTQYFQDSIGSMGFPPESVTVTGVSTGPPVARRRRRRSLLQGDSSSTTAATTTVATKWAVPVIGFPVTVINNIIAILIEQYNDLWGLCPRSFLRDGSALLFVKRQVDHNTLCIPLSTLRR